MTFTVTRDAWKHLEEIVREARAKTFRLEVLDYGLPVTVPGIGFCYGAERKHPTANDKILRRSRVTLAVSKGDYERLRGYVFHYNQRYGGYEIVTREKYEQDQRPPEQHRLNGFVP